MKTYIIEVRDANGKLDFQAEWCMMAVHPFLFRKHEYTMDELCWWASYGEGRNKALGPMELGAFMKGIGVTYREKTW